MWGILKIEMLTAVGNWFLDGNVIITFFVGWNFTHAILPDQAFAYCPRFPTAASRRSLGRVSVPVWLIIQKDQLSIVGLISLYLTNYLILRGLIKQRFLAFLYLGFGPNCLTDSYVLHTRSLLCFYSNLKTTFDLHVLSISLAFILSQDQTLSFKYDFLDRSRFWTYQTSNIKPLRITKQIIIIIKRASQFWLQIGYAW